MKVDEEKADNRPIFIGLFNVVRMATTIDEGINSGRPVRHYLLFLLNNFDLI